MEESVDVDVRMRGGESFKAKLIKLFCHYRT